MRKVLIVVEEYELREQLLTFFDGKSRMAIEYIQRSDTMYNILRRRILRLLHDNETDFAIFLTDMADLNVYINRDYFHMILHVVSVANDPSIKRVAIVKNADGETDEHGALCALPVLNDLLFNVIEQRTLGIEQWHTNPLYLINAYLTAATNQNENEPTQEDTNE